MKYLAVDFGETRIGLATSDASGALATPRQTLSRKSDRQAIAAIAEFARREEVEGFVVGLPHHADGRENELVPRVRSFARKLEETSSLPVTFVNEHLTSHAARSRFPEVEIDAASAAVLLEEFLADPRR
jgi:putative Holliday junction resolvase